LADVNVATDIALCRRCERNFSYAEATSASPEAGVDLSRPPKGAWFQRTARGFVVGASTRSPSALFLVPFMLVWSGGSLGGIYGSQWFSGKFNLPVSLFGIPFVLGSLILGSLALMTVCGQVVVTVESGSGTIFTGVGRLGWRRKFRWNEIATIRTSKTHSNEGGTSEQITMEGKSRVDFASMLNVERRYFMLAALLRMRREMVVGG
jgi:hypothetical protein